MENKPFKSIDEMCCLLIQDRGLICPDDNELRKFLSRTNYYRFSGYARDFQEDPEKGKNSFVGNTSFQDINKLINLDAKLRILLTEQLSVIEIAIRAKLAHEFGNEYGSNAYYLDCKKLRLKKWCKAISSLPSNLHYATSLQALKSLSITCKRWSIVSCVHDPFLGGSSKRRERLSMKCVATNHSSF